MLQTYVKTPAHPNRGGIFSFSLPKKKKGIAHVWQSLKPELIFLTSRQGHKAKCFVCDRFIPSRLLLSRAYVRLKR